MSEPARVIFAVDPGKTTGLACLTQYGVFKSGEYDDQLAFLDWMDYNAFVHNLTVETEIVCESYIVTPETIKKSRQYFSLEIIGALRWMAHKGAAKFTLQSPSAGKSFGTDAKLKSIGWWSPGHGHANDAARHLLLYCVKNNLLPAEKMKKLREGDDAIL